MENKDRVSFESHKTRKVSFQLEDKTMLTFDIPEEYQHFTPEYALILKLLKEVEELKKENLDIKMKLSRDYNNLLNQIHNRINRIENDFDSRLRLRGM